MFPFRASEHYGQYLKDDNHMRSSYGDTFLPTEWLVLGLNQTCTAASSAASCAIQSHFWIVNDTLSVTSNCQHVSNLYPGGF